MADDTPDLLVLTAEIVAAYLGHSRILPEELPALIRSIRDTLSEDTSSPAPVEAPTPNKPGKGEIRKSITPDGLISFVDGKRYKTLKRHLTGAGMTMAQYRERYGLPSDYPSVAPAYSASRSAMAKERGWAAKAAEASPSLRPSRSPRLNRRLRPSRRGPHARRRLRPPPRPSWPRPTLPTTPPSPEPSPRSADGAARAPPAGGEEAYAASGSSSVLGCLAERSPKSLQMRSTP